MTHTGTTIALPPCRATPRRPVTCYIRTVDGIETPAPGAWTITAAAPVVGRRRNWARASTSSGTTLGGALRVGTTAPLVSIDLALDIALGRIRFSSTVMTVERNGLWLLDGTLADEHGVIVDQAARLRYHGVFRSRGRLLAWLTFVARIDTDALATRSSRLRTGRYLDVHVDLNAEPPASLTVAAARHG